MIEKNSKLTVEIFGEAYRLKGDIESERVKQVAAMLDQRMKKISKSNSQLAPSKVAVLAALNLADEYLRLEQDYQQLVKLLKDER